MDSILYAPTLPGRSRPPISHFRLTEEYYYELIVAYSKSALAFPSDKLPAISALAKALGNKLAKENA